MLSGPGSPLSSSPARDSAVGPSRPVALDTWPSISSALQRSSQTPMNATISEYPPH